MPDPGPTPTGPDIDVFDRVKAPSQRGTEGSNLASSSGESIANLKAFRSDRRWDRRSDGGRHRRQPAQGDRPRRHRGDDADGNLAALPLRRPQPGGPNPRDVLYP